MKKIPLITLSLFLLIIFCVVFMFLGKICPPNGPWPMPPWCKNGSSRIVYKINTNPIKIEKIKAVNMMDTWGRNYNMGMIETTQSNIEESFNRVKELGAEEVYVHDFHRAIFEKGKDYTTTNYEIKDETFWNDFRDESISEKDLKKLTEIAHKNNLKLGIKHNISFVNIGKYINKGISGNIQESVVSDYQKFNENHTEEWIKDYFEKWTNRLTNKAKLYEKYGVDILSISPTWMEPTFSGHEELANELQKKLIENLKSVYSGKIYVELNIYGFIEDINGREDYKKYDYYKLADIVEIRIYNFIEKYRSMETEAGIISYLTDINNKAKEKNIKISIFLAPSSYNNSFKNGALEFLDYKSEIVKNTEKDYDYQNKIFELFFKNINNFENIERINVANFSWDDSLDPEVKPKISIGSTFRNKPSEYLIKSWFNK